MAENIIKLPFWGNTSCNLYGMHIFKSESLHFPVFATITDLMLNRFTAYSQYQPPPVSLLQIGSIDARSVQKNTRRRTCCTYTIYFYSKGGMSMKRTHSWNKGVQLLSWFVGALLLAAFVVSCNSAVPSQGKVMPNFTSFTIPNAYISKAGSTVTAIVKGANFKAPGVSKENFSVNCATASITDHSAITIIDDATLNVTLTIPGTANDYTVIISYGSANKAGTFSVKDGTAYAVGKIVLADKTLVDKDDYSAIDPNNPPVGIICAINSYGVPRMIALHTSGSDLLWAKYGSAGYTTKFEGIICEPSTTGSGAAQTATFTGDTDGSDNWEYIKSIDPAGAANAATNYPAFNWVNTYNETYKTKLNNKTFAWYMPSLAELCEVYKNKAAINESLTKIRGLDSNYADESLGTSWYWSSSQYSYYYYDAWSVYFGGGYVDYNLKDGIDRVCCLSGF